MATTVDLITNGSIVNNEWVGTGVFDGLMHAVNKNIEVQYNNGRIAGQDYANIYLGGLQAVLQQSIMFVLQKDTNDAQAAEILDATKRANAALNPQVLKAKIDNRISINGLNASNIELKNKTTREELTGTAYTVDTLTAINNETI